MLNLRVYLGIGYYSVENSFVNVYPEGIGGIYVRLNINYQSGNRYQGTGTISTLSVGNIQRMGLINLTYYLYVNDFLYTAGSENYDPVINTFKIEQLMHANKNNNVSLRGSANLSFEISGTPQNDTINFLVSYIIPYSDYELSRSFSSFEILILWVEFFLIVFIIILGYFAVKAVKTIRFDLYYTDEMRKSNEEFFRKLAQKKRREE